MKKLLYLSLLVFLTEHLTVNAQATFPTMDSLDINNINAAVLVHGDMWWNPTTQTGACFFPKGSQKSIGFASALWMSGYDGSGQLHVAAQTYRQEGNDYWPGPLDSRDTVTYADSYHWAKIWKVKRSDIQYFQSLSAHTISNTPDAILTWPAKGNTNAQGNGGDALTITTDMAPFIDLNGNGVYEPLLGDYPDIKGDEALWWVFSDNGATHTQTNGRPFGVEVHVMSYAYSRGTLIDNVIYYDYTIVNKSANNYSNFRAGLFADIDIGYYLDDFIGFDSVHRMGIQYNGTNDDDGGSAGHPPNSYGTIPPMVGVTMISLPGDAGTSYVPAGSFTYYNNDYSIIGNPFTDTECNNYMRSMIKDGEHLSNDFLGPGVPSKGYGSGYSSNYVYTGDPSDTSQWSECVCNNNPGDRRFVLASNDFTLNAGSSQHVVLALVVADSAGGCPHTSFSGIKIVADTAWSVYQNPPPVLPTAVGLVSAQNTLSVYPNPAHDKLYIENTGKNAGAESVTLYNFLGQAIPVKITKDRQRSVADISALPAGLYHILYRQGSTQTGQSFVKE